MAFQIKVPAVGESITEATIGEWTKKDGEFVNRDEVVLLLETDKASVEVVAETAGVLKTSAKAGDVVAIGAVVGEIDDTAKASGGGAAKAAPKEEASPAKAAPKEEAAPAKKSASADEGVPQPGATGSDKMGPAVKKMIDEAGLNAADIKATGPKGNITKEDVMAHMESNKGGSAKPAAKESAASSAKPAAPASKTPQMPVITGGSQESERVPMTTLRKKIAERLVQAQHTAAILTTFNEVDMSAILNLRKKYKEDFQKKHDVGLGFMGFFVKAVVQALKAHPKVNAFIDGSDMVFHNYCNIGIAVGTEKGLIVPVIKNAEMMTIAQIEMAIKAYAGKARDGKISVDDLSGGTFTISNGGVYGSLMSTPILNPPQSGILGMHKIEERPVVVDGQIVIRPMMYLALSYDHRIIDGSESVTFLVKVKEALEDPTRLVLEI